MTWEEILEIPMACECGWADKYGNMNFLRGIPRCPRCDDEEVKKKCPPKLT